MEIVEILEVHRRLRAFDPTYVADDAEGPTFCLPSDGPVSSDERPSRPSPLALDVATLVTRARAVAVAPE